MNYTKLLSELIMKNGRIVKLNKKYFISVLIAFATQITFGVNLVGAMQCEREIEQDWSNARPDSDNPNKRWIKFFDRSFSGTLEETKSAYYSEFIEYLTQRDGGGAYQWQLDGKWKSCREAMQVWHSRLISDGLNTKEPGHACAIKYMRDNDCNNIEVFKYDKGSRKQSSSNNSSSNQSNSGSSSQSNKKANRQSANNQSSSSGSEQPNVENYAEMDDKSLLSAYNLAVDNNQPDKEFKALLELANRGNAAGQFNLGVRYANGDGTKQDFAKAMYWYEQAEKKQHAGATFNLGNMYYKGLGITADDKKAFSYWFAAALRNDLDAITQVGEAYFYGIGVSKNEYSANSYTEEAAKRGHPRAIENLKKFDY